MLKLLMVKFKITLFGRPWSFYSIPDQLFIAKHGAGLAGLSLLDEHRVDIKESELTLETVIHELTHVYWSNLCIETANLKPHQLEEVTCELMATHASTIIRTSKFILKHLT